METIKSIFKGLIFWFLFLLTISFFVGGYFGMQLMESQINRGNIICKNQELIFIKGDKGNR